MIGVGSPADLFTLHGELYQECIVPPRYFATVGRKSRDEARRLSLCQVHLQLRIKRLRSAQFCPESSYVNGYVEGDAAYVYDTGVNA